MSSSGIGFGGGNSTGVGRIVTMYEGHRSLPADYRIPDKAESVAMATIPALAEDPSPYRETHDGRMPLDEDE